MTSTNYSQIGVLIAILCLIVPSWQAATRPHAEFFKRVTPLGWVLFIVAFLFGIISLLGLKASSAEQEQAKLVADSIRKADRDTIIQSIQDALKEYNLTYDTAKKSVDSIIVSDKLASKANEPLIDLANVLPNALLEKEKGTDSGFIFHLGLRNIGTGTAYNLKDFHLALIPVNDTYIIKENNGHASNEGVTVQNSMPFVITTFFSVKPIPDTVFFYSKISYADSLNHSQKPFRRIFKFTSNQFNQQLPELNSYDYGRIKRTLIDQKKW